MTKHRNASSKTINLFRSSRRLVFIASTYYTLPRPSELLVCGTHAKCLLLDWVGETFG
jgi:hypothetical protein